LHFQTLVCILLDNLNPMPQIASLPDLTGLDLNDPYVKGFLFEQYVKGLFNDRFFKIEKWRKSERNIPEQFPGDHSGPDLELTLFGNRRYKFAVECKWRAEFNNDNKVKWAKDHHIGNYIAYKAIYNIDVFVAIGIGGLPYDPEELYVTPLHYINKSIWASKSDLLVYNHKPGYKFFYLPPKDEGKQGELF
jgi:hypothetical protein